MRRLGGIAVAAWLCLCVFSSGARADAGANASAMRFELRSHSGYRIRVSASRAAVGLTVIHDERARHAEISVTYLARADISGDTIKADFGDLGRLRMHFLASSRAPIVICEGGRHHLAREGVFVGSLRFQGEGDYVGVDTRRAKGRLVALSPSSSCHPPAASARGKRQRRPKETFLLASFRKGLNAIDFGAETDGAGRARFQATDESGGDGVAIYRHAFLEASPLTFATDKALSFAGVSPPYPFSGTGVIGRNADGSRSWTGSLAVSFPDGTTVGLTGPAFKTWLTRQW